MSLFRPNILKRSLQYLFAFLGCLHLCGGPLGLMQGIAWMKMAVAYSAEDGIVQGVKKTFDGDHPCRLCCAIEQARQEQDQSPQAPLLPKANELKIAKEFMPLGEISLPVVFPRETELEARRDPVLSDGQPAASPQSPPPRLV